jgi:GT2 family glycosyltransferase
MSGFKVGLVTVLFNSDDVLEGFFKSLSIQTFKESHLYLIDNTPNLVTDNIIHELTKKYNIGNFTHIKNEKNEGVAKGNNQGIDLCLKNNCEFTLLLNNDIEFENENLIQGLLQKLISKEEKIVVPKILFYDSKKIWMAGGYINQYTAKAFHIGEGQLNDEKYAKEIHCNYAPTCFMILNNDVFRDIGLMDEKYFVYYDDVDFIFRAVKAGYKVFYSPDFEVLHKVSSLTGGKESNFSIHYGTRNRIYFIRKSYKGIKLIFSLTITILGRIYRYLQFDESQKRSLLRGLREGFLIKI